MWGSEAASDYGVAARIARSVAIYRRDPGDIDGEREIVTSPVYEFRVDTT
jgi:hypothetical protein